MRTAEEIREHLIEQLNGMLKRPGMYGGWVAAMTVMWNLGYIDGLDEVHVHVVDSNARMPTRLVSERIPDPREDVYHSLFLPEIHRRGWFRPSRFLTADEHADLVAALDLWISHDRTRTDVIEMFGQPSWAHGGWQGSPRVMVYAAANPSKPMVYLVVVEDVGVIAAWVAEHLFPVGLHVTAAGKGILASPQII